MTTHQLKRFAKYCSRFGLLRGAWIFARLKLPASFPSRTRTVRVVAPNCRAPLTLRRGTRDVEVFEQVFLDKEYEFAFAFEPEVIIDAGAHAGYATVYFANEYPRARIIAVEPEKSNFDLLQKNASPYRNVTCIHAAVWNRGVSLKIANPEAENWLFRVAESEAGESDSCRAVTVCDLMAVAGVDRVDILKVDIEGAEKTVFASDYSEWLDKVRAIVIELHDWLIPGCSTAFYRATSQYSFSQFQKGENIVLVRT